MDKFAIKKKNTWSGGSQFSDSVILSSLIKMQYCSLNDYAKCRCCISHSVTAVVLLNFHQDKNPVSEVGLLQSTRVLLAEFSLGCVLFLGWNFALSRATGPLKFQQVQLYSLSS